MGEKTKLDYALTITQITVSAALTLVGIALTGAQVKATEERDALQRRSLQYSTLADITKRCMSTDANEQSQILSIVAFMSTEIPSRNSTKADDTFETTMKFCSQLVSRRQASSPPSLLATSPAPATPPSATIGSKWVYLGTYQQGEWRTHYLDFPPTMDPAKFTQTSPGAFKVQPETGALNLRTGEFSLGGDFPPVTSSLGVGRRVKILNTWQWFDSGNWWAKVEVL